MSDELSTLIAGYLDDRLSTTELARLNALLRDDPDRQDQFARSLMLHDRLRAEWSAAPWTDAGPTPLSRQETAPRQGRPWPRTAVMAVAALLLLGIVVWQATGVSSASAAATALDRVIEAVRLPIDRVYQIRVTDPGPAGAVPPVFSGGQGRKPGIDGAQLSIRGPDQFVLVRFFGNGTQFVTGSDGQLGWAVPPKGPVHLSQDERRFRRAVPGEREELPFVDVQAGLSELRRGYALELIEADKPGLRRLRAQKKPGGRSGPEQVEIDFDADGVAWRIALHGLPADEMRAEAVVLELVEQRDLGPDFFRHDAHHAADRPLNWE